jgi:CBS domain-containing protein
MTTDPVKIGPGDSAAEARELLESSAIHHLPVVENGKLVGIVSSADLLKLYMLDDEVALSALATVSQIMELNPVILAVTATLRDAAEKLMSGGFHALPVVDADRNLVGIVTSVDLIDALLKSLPVGDGSIVEAPEHSLSDLIEDNRLMRQVCNAAELYVRSGHAEHEHSVLIKCLAAVRRRKESVDV